MEREASARRYDIDWLRVAATYLLLLFHGAMVFNPAPFYHIRNDEVSFFFLILCGFISLWHMPLFFLLAGWSAYSSLSLRGTTGFLKERFFRLFVPLVTGCVLLMPSIKYLELSSGFDANYTGLYVVPELQASFRQVIPSGLPEARPFAESFLEFLPTFYTDLARFTWAHLWFVAYLLTFTVIYLPLFRWVARSGRRFGNRPRSWVVYTPVLPLAVIQVLLRPHWPGLQNLVDDWANFAYYSTYLFAGLLLARFPGLESVLHRERTRALGIALASTLVLLLGVLGAFEWPSILLANTAIAGWCFVVAFLGWARTKLAFSTPTLSYLTESAFPVYLLHQSAIVVPGYFLIQLPLGHWSKFLLVFSISTALTVGAYHFLVRPFAVPRFLCGMKVRPRALRGAVAMGASAAAVVLAVLASPLVGSATRLAADPSPVGRWYAEGGAAQVEIESCRGEICGRVVWLRSPYDEDGCELRDRQNPDETLHERPILGLEILWGLRRTADTEPTWTGGTIYDPSSGSTYRATLTVVDENHLEVRGYIGIPLIGRTTSWFRVGAERMVCSQRSLSESGGL